MRTLTYTLAFLASLALLGSSCESKKSAEDEDLSRLKTEVIQEHDIAMVKMGKLMKLKKELNAKNETVADSTISEEIDWTIRELDEAHESMMNWMRNFSQNFPAGTLMESGMDHEGHGNEEESEMMEDEGFYNSLQEELVKIQKVDQQIDQAISKGKLMIGE